MWWEMSFVKLLAECCLVVLWSWGFLGVGGWGSGCRQLPAFLQRSALGPGSLLSPMHVCDPWVLAFQPP